jgi:GNAT superfamily N-acetyltransferase
MIPARNGSRGGPGGGAIGGVGEVLAAVVDDHADPAWGVDLVDVWWIGDPGAGGGGDEAWMICPETIDAGRLALIEKDITDAGGASTGAPARFRSVHYQGVRRCQVEERERILEVINAAAVAYRGVIPDDCWREPYMPASELDHEIAAGVAFLGYDLEGSLIGVMGVQPVGDVELIRHAYVMPGNQRRGVGAALLRELRRLSTKPMLVGTWAAAEWAIRFYQRHGFALVGAELTPSLLRRYWSISDRQIATSTVLANPAWQRR